MLFDDGILPPAEETLKSAAEELKKNEEKPKPFSGRTMPYATYRSALPRVSLGYSGTSSFESEELFF